jgi:hypothetical protein
MLISTALLLDSIIRNSVCTPAKLPCRRVEVGYKKKIINTGHPKFLDANSNISKIQSIQKENKSEQALQIIGHVVAKSCANKRSMQVRR